MSRYTKSSFSEMEKLGSRVCLDSHQLRCAFLFSNCLRKEKNSMFLMGPKDGKCRVTDRHGSEVIEADPAEIRFDKKILDNLKGATCAGCVHSCA